MTQPVGSGKSVIKVKLLRAGRIIRSYKIRSEVFTVGTAEGCNIRAGGDPNVRPLHASIYIDDGELTLVPEPDAVVYLNDAAVDFAVPKPDDIIRIGKLTIQVELVESLTSVPPGVRHSAAPPTSSRSVSAAPRRPASAAPSPAAVSAVPSAVPRPSSSPVLPKPSMAPKLASPDAVSRPSVSLGAGIPKASVPMARPVTALPMVEPVLPKATLPVELPPVDISFDTGADTVLSDEDDMNRVSVPPRHISDSTESLAEDRETSDPVQIGSFESLDADYFYGDDDEDFDDTFDLTSMLLSERPAALPGPVEPYSVAYIVRVVDGSVAQSFGVTPGAAYTTFDKELSCYIEVDKKDKKGKNNKLFLKAAPSVKGELRIGGEKRTLAEHSEPFQVEMADGDRAVLEGLGGIYKVDVYRPPLAPRKTPFFAVSGRMLVAVIILALAFHGAAAYALRYVDMSKFGDVTAEQEEVFAEVQLDKVEDPKPLEEAAQELPKEDAATIAERAPNVSQKTIKKRVKEAEQRTKSVSSLLNVLSRGSGKPGESNKLKDMISNIDAVRSASGTSSSFSIAGAIASLPGNGVNIARSGGGGAISTLSGDDVAGKGSEVASVGQGKRSGKVRGKVTKMSSGAKIGGSLSQEDVLRVINSNIHAIQACYERALMSNPSLNGRIAMDWTVSSTGGVKNVRVRSSTMGNPQVADCMSAKIKRWKFPRPKGGEAQITFPFLFRSGS